MKGSWKTSVAGVATIIAALATAVSAMFDSDPNTVPEWGLLIGMLFGGAGLMLARDNDKSSEAVGAKK